MQPVWLRIVSRNSFKETFENTWWKDKIDATSVIWIVELMTHFKTHIGKKQNKWNCIGQPFWQQAWIFLVQSVHRYVKPTLNVFCVCYNKHLFLKTVEKSLKLFCVHWLQWCGWKLCYSYCPTGRPIVPPNISFWNCPAFFVVGFFLSLKIATRTYP